MPRYGFNFQWMYRYEPEKLPRGPDYLALDFMAEHELDFVRLPLDYRFWCPDFDYFHPREQMFRYIDDYLDACRERGLHLSLNLHRAPGYCINENHLEKHNLWRDEFARDAFIFYWQQFAERYNGIPNDYLSFDLVNEPPAMGQYGLTRENHAALIRRTVAAIREIDPDREIAIDGLDGGNQALPELADLGVVHSGRGYQPMAVTHYRAEWWGRHNGLPAPVYPNTRWDNKIWNRDTLMEFYQPWRNVQESGVTVHIGEMGCYNQTPNEVALRWFADLLGVFKSFGWGYALWQFAGPFGIVRHGRAGAKYERLHGFEVDRALLELFLNHRVAAMS